MLIRNQLFLNKNLPMHDCHLPAFEQFKLHTRSIMMVLKHIMTDVFMSVPIRIIQKLFSVHGYCFRA